MYKFLLFIFVILLFISKNSLFLFGIASEDGSHFTRILPAFYLILIFILLNVTKIKWIRLKYPIYTVLFLCFVLIFNKQTGRDIDISMYMNALILPLCLSFILLGLVNTNKKVSIQTRKLILFFFIIECSLAIIERVTNYNLFPFVLQQDFQVEDNLFRSSALYGHALSNALIVCIIWSFILFSDMKLEKKITYIGLGFLALLSFNTRFAIIASILLLIVYAYFFMRNMENKKTKRRFILYIACFGIASLFILLALGWGGRLLEMGLYDSSSASVRTDLFKIFEYFNINNFLLGIPAEEVQFIKEYSGIASLIIENYWLIYLFRFGLFFLIILTILYILVFKEILKGYNRFIALSLSFFFLLVSSSNNSLDTGDPYLAIFFLCCYAFRDTEYLNLNKIK